MGDVLIEPDDPACGRDLDLLCNEWKAFDALPREIRGLADYSLDGLLGESDIETGESPR